MLQSQLSKHKSRAKRLDKETPMGKPNNSQKVEILKSLFGMTS
jgi:hypothetical protein